MNIIKSGNQYQIYSEDNIKTYNLLPAGTYDVNFSKFTGFFLTSRENLSLGEEKIYGGSERKVNKILNSFELSTRNLGAILSGPKGVGKSLIARMIADKSVKYGFPVVIISSYVPGIASFISSIKQETVVIFDEFEKMFGCSDENDPQEELLSLFDGIDTGKKLFIITCNEVDELNSYLINRPGRFHYHFVIENPTPEEIEEYMKDKLKPEYYDCIPQIINFSFLGSITYDCLRAIAFEINNGYSLEETLQDLNISRERCVYFNAICIFEDGEVCCATTRAVNLASRYDRMWFEPTNNYELYVEFNPKLLSFNKDTHDFTIPTDSLKAVYDFSRYSVSDEDQEYFDNRKIVSFSLQRASNDSISHYYLNKS